MKKEFKVIDHQYRLIYPDTDKQSKKDDIIIVSLNHGLVTSYKVWQAQQEIDTLATYEQASDNIY